MNTAAPQALFAVSASVHLPTTYLWATIILLAVLVYTVLDGFDLGVGMLAPTVRDPRARHGLSATIAPFWDGNETWLVLAGAGLLAGFPTVYANVLSSLAVPLSLLLVGLILRGAGLEFSHHVSPRCAPRWDLVFCFGSWLASFCIGMAGGLLLQLSPLRGESPRWLDPLPWLAGLGMCWMHALLGAAWLSLKAEGQLRQQMRQTARTLLVAMPAWPLVLMLAAAPGIRPPGGLAAAIWVATVLLALKLHRQLAEPRQDLRSFLALMALAALSFSGWGFVLVDVLNHSQDLSWQQLAAPQSSMKFTVYGALLLLPLIAGYSLWGYHVFKGRLVNDRGGLL